MAKHPDAKVVQRITMTFYNDGEVRTSYRPSITQKLYNRVNRSLRVVERHVRDTLNVD